MSLDYVIKPLDPSLYFLDPKLEKLFKTSTGIQDDEELKAHIMKVQKEAYRSFPYPCIRLFSFTRLAVPDVPSYQEVLRLGRERDDVILLEIGCGFGNDIRKVVDDGFPPQNIVVCDINPQLWEIGHRLFRSDSQTFSVKYIEADIFDEAALSSTATPPPSPPWIRTLSTLTPLKGHVSIVLLQMVFHLFGRGGQALLAHRIGQLLSPVPGSLVLGRQMGDSKPRDVIIDGSPHFVHNPESWEQMWSSVFPKGTVEYRAELRDLPSNLAAAAKEMVQVSQFLTWSITRL